jgi:hypothetical protein
MGGNLAIECVCDDKHHVIFPAIVWFMVLVAIRLMK